MSALAAFRKDLTDDEYYRGLMLGSFMIFVQTFFPIMTGRPFKLSNSPGREPYQLTMARELRASFDGTLKDDNGKLCQHLMINIPPRYGKTSMLHYFTAWCIAKYPDSNFLYISYEKDLAALQTLRIREIVQHPEFEKYFGVRLTSASRAKEYFETSAGGSCFAAGSGGAITGRGAGIKGCDRFGGAMIVDDIHKPKDVTSDTMREEVINWLYNTAQSRLNDPKKTPAWFIGQTLHEVDAYDHLKKVGFCTKGDVKVVRLSVRDAAGNVLDPAMHTKEMCQEMEGLRPYEFWAQYMQQPQPAGGGIFKPEWFVIRDMEPEIIRTFITIDTAETDKSYNDATVFSLWGLYKIKVGVVDTGVYGLHWLDCRELRVEPKDLEPQFYAFYMNAMRGIKQPDVCCIEKKSTGTTMISVLKDMQGLRIIEVERFKQKNRAYTKIDRFLECQSYIAAKKISFSRGAEHVDKCIEHCRKITANNTHAFDDIADTMQMAIQCALIEGILLPFESDPTNTIKTLTSDFGQNQRLQKSAMQWDYQ
jgi:predicted phage terminase large subunit-like protein